MVGSIGWTNFQTITYYVGLAFHFLFYLLNLPFGGLVGWVAIIHQLFRAFISQPHKRYIENQNY